MTTTERLRTGTRMSLDEFLALGEADGKWELDDGVLYIMATGSPDHQFLMRWLCRPIEDYFLQFDQPPAQLIQEMTTILSPELQRAPEPDIVIILNERRHIVSRVRVEAPPDIVVEILSTDRSRDLVRKRQIYAEAGVLEYWLMDPRSDTITLLELRDGAYVERAVLSAADSLTTPLLPGLAIPLESIFQHTLRPPRDE
ncbi:MAG: Uma2 family endonuclease [Chloroflexota bacterium]|nr:Uma2 family endonuclease [Chloroflexota bacterium]MDE2684178.1 Uma2 family endonuclease [Chloroflexota bacterium]